MTLAAVTADRGSAPMCNSIVSAIFIRVYLKFREEYKMPYKILIKAFKPKLSNFEYMFPRELSEELGVIKNRVRGLMSPVGPLTRQCP